MRDQFDSIRLPRLFGRRGDRATVADAHTTTNGFAVENAGDFWDVLDDEKVPELQWPNNLQVYDDMRRQDAQIISVLRAVTLPIRRTPWRIDPNGASPEVVAFVAANLGLGVKGQEGSTPPRQRDRFSWAEHLQLALTCLAFGHSFFEVQCRIAPDETGTLRAWLRKLEWRPPKTITRIDVARDGGLIAIEQGVLGAQTENNRMKVNTLVAYVNEREGGNWLGQSLLRPAYKFWILKDRLLRIQAQTIDRNGMGVPLYVGPEMPKDVYDATGYEKRQKDDLANGLKIARSFRSGRQSGAAVAHSADLKLLGVEGTLPDANKPIRYYDEQISRAVLANFLNLGGDSSKGSYALGETFADFFTMSLQTVALAIADTASKHIVEDLVDINFGTGVPAPRIVFDEIGSQQRITAEGIRALLEAGGLTADDDLERFIRQTFGLPERDTSTTRPRPNTTSTTEEAA